MFRQNRFHHFSSIIYIINVLKKKWILSYIFLFDLFVIYFIKFPSNSITNNNWKVSRRSPFDWNPIPNVIFPGRKSVIYDSGRIIWVFTQIEIKFYHVFNSNNCSMFVWRGKSSSKHFSLFSSRNKWFSNNFPLIVYHLNIISIIIYILFCFFKVHHDTFKLFFAW